MTLTATCPKCGRSGKAPSDAAGKRAKCKGCGTTFVIGGEPRSVTSAGRSVTLVGDAAHELNRLAQLLRRQGIAVNTPNQVTDGQPVLFCRRAQGPISPGTSAALAACGDRSLAPVGILLTDTANCEDDELRELAAVEMQELLSSTAAECPSNLPVLRDDDTKLADRIQKLMARPISLCRFRRTPPGADAQLPTSRSDGAITDGTIVVFGPESHATVAALAESIDPSRIVSRENIEDLTLPPGTVRNFSVVFAHNIPRFKGRRKTERDVQEWASRLLAGASYTPAGFQNPDLSWYSDAGRDPSVSLKLFWREMDTSVCLQIARSLQSSFVDLGGAVPSSHSVPPTEPDTHLAATALALKRCTKCGADLEELRHSCPKCRGTSFMMNMETSAETLRKQTEAATLVTRGDQYARQGKYEDAESALRKAIEINPYNETAYGNLGGVFYFQGRYAEAIPWLERALEINPHIAGIGDALTHARDEARKTGSQTRVSDQEAQPRTEIIVHRGKSIRTLFEQRGLPAALFVTTSCAPKDILDPAINSALANSIRVFSWVTVKVGPVHLQTILAMAMSPLASPSGPDSIFTPLRSDQFTYPPGDRRFFSAVHVMPADQTDKVAAGLWLHGAALGGTIVSHENKCYVIPNGGAEQFVTELRLHGSSVLAKYQSFDDPTARYTKPDGRIEIDGAAGRRIGLFGRLCEPPERLRLASGRMVLAAALYLTTCFLVLSLNLIVIYSDAPDTGPLGVLISALGLGLGILVLLGAVWMRQRKFYTLCVASSIAAILPLCCVIPPVCGIFALVVLRHPAVRGLFRS